MKHELFPTSRARIPLDKQARSTRAIVSLVAEVRFGMGDWHKSRLVDLSESGFRLAWAPHGEPGAAFAIRIAGLETLRGVVRWRDTSGIGCQFDSPLSPYVFEHLARLAGEG